VLVEMAGRLDPPQLRQAVEQLCRVADPEGADRQAERRHERRGVWLSPTWEGMVAVDGLLEPEAGTTLLAALEPLARPAGAGDGRTGGQRTADALWELARRVLEGGGLPKAGGVRPQLLVTVDLDSLLGHPNALGGETGWAGPLDPEACRRLACDGALTRVLVTRQHPYHYDPGHGASADPSADQGPATPDPSGSERLTTPPLARDRGGQQPDERPATQDPDHDQGPLVRDPDHHPSRDRDNGLAARLQAAMTLLPPILGGAPTQPLEVGRTTRVIQPAQRAALAVRDGGCVFPNCERLLAWCEAHHLRHWLHGGPTDLANLALLCRAHHRAVHEGGWRLTRQPDGRLTATPPHRRHRRRVPAA
jgi:hypothetical protein